METVYLSRRNLLGLISKLDRKKAGEQTFCTLIKNDTQHTKFPQTMEQIAVVAVDDDEYYVERSAGLMHPKDVK